MNATDLAHKAAQAAEAGAHPATVAMLERAAEFAGRHFRQRGPSWEPPAAGPVGIECGVPEERDSVEPDDEPTQVSQPATSTWCKGTIEADLVERIRQNRTWSAHELGADLHRDPRAIRALIAHLRSDHKLPICSTPNAGFFWPRRVEDAEHTLASLESRRIEIQRAIDGIHAGLVREFGTAELFPRNPEDERV